MKNKIFDHFKDLFSKHGFNLYMIGGTSRNFLLNVFIDDYDFTTDATPEDMKDFLPDANYTFSKFGCVRTKYDGINIDITTHRKENQYLDSRHPNKIEFTKSIEEDSKRRDFTINAIYIDKDYQIHDFYNGVKDLKGKVIRMIGDPDTRLKEDPLRILRAYRFSIVFNFDIDQDLRESMTRNKALINNLNEQKIKEEINKLRKHMKMPS